MVRIVFFFIPIAIYLNSIFFSLVYTPSQVTDLDVDSNTVITFFGTTPRVNGIMNIYFQSRVEKIQEIFDRIPDSKVLISGFHTTNYSEIDSMIEAITDLGINKNQIVTHYAADTFDTMRQLKKMHKTKPETQIVLVSQKFHLERANFIAKLLDIPIKHIQTNSFNSRGHYRLLIREYFARIKAYSDVLKYYTMIDK